MVVLATLQRGALLSMQPLLVDAAKNKAHVLASKLEDLRPRTLAAGTIASVKPYGAFVRLLGGRLTVRCCRAFNFARTFC